MNPGNYDFTVYRGASFEREIRIENNLGAPVPFPGFTPRMVLRTDYETSTTILAVASWRDDDEDTGAIVVRLTSSKTLLLTSSRYVYNLEIEDPNGNVERVLQGIVHVRE